MKTLHNMKFRVNSPGHSEEIQRELIRLGYSWNDRIENIKNKHAPYLFCHSNGQIKYTEYGY